MAISVDGMTLFHDGSATASSGPGDFAVAVGADSNATVVGDNSGVDAVNVNDLNAFAAGGDGSPPSSHRF